MGLISPFFQFLSDRILRLPVPRKPLDSGLARPIARVLVFGKFPNPSFDYYFAARLAAEGMPEFELIDIGKFDQATEARGAFVLIIRYASLALTGWIRKNRNVLAGVAVFVDDDMAAAITDPQASMRYRYRLLSQSVLPLRLLDGLIDVLWVSTEVLARRLAYARPQVLAPAPARNVIPIFAPPSARDVRSTTLIAYHATAIHVAEHRFLIPIIKSVLAARPSVHFEVIAAGKSADMWRQLACERITVKPPLPWDVYVMNQDRPIDIMVVPLAPSRLNDCRAETKRIDVVRVRAAAVISDCLAFAPGETGEVLVPYEQTVWVQSLIKLVDNARDRELASMATRRRVEEMARRAQTGIEMIRRRTATSQVKQFPQAG